MLLGLDQARAKCALRGILAGSSSQEKDLYSMGNALIRGAKWLETHSTIVVIGIFFFLIRKRKCFSLVKISRVIGFSREAFALDCSPLCLDWCVIAACP